MGGVALASSAPRFKASACVTISYVWEMSWTSESVDLMNVGRRPGKDLGVFMDPGTGGFIR